MAEPRVRASQPLELLAHLATHDPITLKRLRSVAPAPALAQLDTAVRTDWIPVDSYDAVTEALLGIMGPARYRETLKTYTVSVVDGPLFGAIMGTTRRLFGVTPGTLIKVFPSGFNLAFRDFGACTAFTDSEQRLAKVEFRAVNPRNLCHSFVTGNLGALDAFVQLSRATAEVTADQARVKEGHLTLSVRWN